MKQTRSLMGMHITIEVADQAVSEKDIDDVYDYFTYVDQTFSTYKENSEISKINRGELKREDYSDDMDLIFTLCERTKKETNGYFDISHDGKLNPSGIVKGWSIFNAAQILQDKGFENYYVDAGGDVQVAGKNKDGEFWRVGIQNPFQKQGIVKVLQLKNCGIATSGTAQRGQHIYNPHFPGAQITDIVSLTVVGPNVYEADRFATPAFAMGRAGIQFIEKLPGFEGYLIDKDGIATLTSGFEQYLVT